MEVLVLLAQRRGEVVPKSELFEHVWAGTFVSDDALTRCIGELRRAFDDDARNPAVIRTISKRGYILVPPVAWGEERPARRSWLAAVVAAVLLAAAGLALTAARPIAKAGSPPPVRAIAVLPLAGVSPGGDPDYIAEGLTNELIAELAKIRAWRVIAGGSTVRYRESHKPLRQIARDLTADAVVTGSVSRADGKVRVHAQMVEAATGRHVWYGSVERDASEAASLQKAIAQSIVSELHLALSPSERQRLAQPARAEPRAYEAYLKGWHHFNRSEFAKAAAQFERATAEDSQFALAWAMLYEADSMVSFGMDRPLSPRALHSIERARAIDPDLAEVHAAAGDVAFYWQWDFKTAETEYRRAVELDPGSVDAAFHYALFLHAMRRWDEALRAYKRVLQLDPVSIRSNAQLLTFYVHAHRYEQALEHYRTLMELESNRRGAGHQRAGIIYERLGRPAEALAAYLKSHEGGAESAELEAAARAEGLAGYWRKRLGMALGRPDARERSPLDLARLYAHAGDVDKAIDCMEAAYEARAPRLVWIAAGAEDNVRGHPRFRALLRRIGFPE